MAVRIKITCDTPAQEQPAPSITPSEYRCFSTTMEGIHLDVEVKDIATAKARLKDAIKMANVTGWRMRNGRLYCPGCARRLSALNVIRG